MIWLYAGTRSTKALPFSSALNAPQGTSRRATRKSPCAVWMLTAALSLAESRYTISVGDGRPGNGAAAPRPGAKNAHDMKRGFPGMIGAHLVAVVETPRLDGGDVRAFGGRGAVPLLSNLAFHAEEDADSYSVLSE